VGEARAMLVKRKVKNVARPKEMEGPGTKKILQRGSKLQKSAADC